MNRTKLKVNYNNATTGLILLVLTSVVGTLVGIDAKTETGQVFYLFVAFLTAYCFPWLQVVEEKDEP